MESKCFTRCIRKPGVQSEKSDEVKALKTVSGKILFLGMFG